MHQRKLGETCILITIGNDKINGYTISTNNTSKLNESYIFLITFKHITVVGVRRSLMNKKALIFAIATVIGWSSSFAGISAALKGGFSPEGLALARLLTASVVFFVYA